MRKRIPRKPPNIEAKNICTKCACKFNIYKAGIVKIAPATITPEAAPIDCIITFSPKAFFLLKSVDNPTAMIAIGIAASKT